MKLKKYALIVPALALTFSVAVPMQFANADSEPVTTDQEEMLLQEFFAKFTGKVVEIRKTEDQILIRVEDEDKGVVDFKISASTYLTSDEKQLALEDIKEGDSLTAYYVNPQVMTMIYPAQYEAAVLVKNDEQGFSNITVDRFAESKIFDKGLLSDAGDLILNIDEKTEIVTQQGQPYEGDLTDKVLVVHSSVMLLSYPAQTTPQKIVVLDLEANEAEDNTTEGSYRENVEIYMNGRLVKDAKIYSSQGKVMVPLRALAEAAGYEVSWNSVSKQIVVGAATTFAIGEDAYTIGRMVPQQLGAAPELKDGLTYVPMDFFTELLGYEVISESDAYMFQEAPQIQEPVAVE